MNSIKPEYDVVIVGAGHSGLCLSYLLSKSKIDHIILEKNEIGSTWINQRWDNFKFVTPNKFNVLLPEDISFFGDTEFCSAKDFSAYLKDFAFNKQLPVFENHTVNSISNGDGDYKFSLQVSSNFSIINLKAKTVAVCSGYQNAKYIPAFADKLSESILQIHSSQYKNSKALSEGVVLVVGSGQSGVQIAEDLVLNGRKVFLSTSKVGRLPRNYLDRDTVELLNEIGFYDVKREEINDSQIFSAPQPQLSGNSKTGDISLSYLEKKGVELLGSLKSIDSYAVQLNDDLADNIVYADEFARKMEQLIEENINPKESDNRINFPIENYSMPETFTTINLEKEKITNVIWCTGFRPDYYFLEMNYKNADGSIIHKNGISPINGLYFLGIPWQRRRKSGIIMGAFEDATEICNTIILRQC